jgi:hypothetical protein
MTAYNVVRLRVKAGLEDEFLAHFGAMGRNFPGMRKAALIKTGERSYCSIGEWDSFGDIVGARPSMIANLDMFRHTLELLSDDVGVTDAVSGEAVLEIGG